MKIPEQKDWPWRSRLCRYLEGREAWAIFCLGFFLRIFLLVITRQFEGTTGASEPLNVAHSLVRYGSFANPYSFATGPTATVPPIYPYYLSLLLRLTGGGVGFVVIRKAIAAGAASFRTHCCRYSQKGPDWTGVSE